MIILDTNALITFLGDVECNEYYNLVCFLKQKSPSTLALPMPAIAEFIAGDECPDRADFLFSKNSKLLTLDFDMKSALVSAEIYRNYRQLPNMLKANVPHQKIKVDIQILGIALANKAKAIVSRDKGINTIVTALNLDIEVCNFADITTKKLAI